MSKIRTDDILESLHKLRIRQSDQLKTVLELYEFEIHQKISKPDYQKLNTMVKRGIDQKIRSRNFEARNERIETGAVVRNRRDQGGAERGPGECYQWKAKGQCSKETIVVAATRGINGETGHQSPPLLQSRDQKNMVKHLREERVSDVGVCLIS